jgi:hypothetical protein
MSAVIAKAAPGFRGRFAADDDYLSGEAWFDSRPASAPLSLRTEVPEEENSKLNRFQLCTILFAIQGSMW